MSYFENKRIQEQLEYNPETGVFTWLVSKQGGTSKGDVAGCKTGGRIQIHVEGKLRMAHHLAYMFMTGEYPEGQVEHINGDKLDNRWSNLRLKRKWDDIKPRQKSNANTSGYTGVSFHKPSNTWRANICHECRVYSLGYYKTPEEAAAAYEAKAKELRGAFYRAPE